ncbi:unnamed protein product [Trifolium pratense]|uniref:Uncharacterized protein n=1 Tax=Trifolium pratense TaxID=57577 RepID=A0ACB0JG45_TRIPR|nr:unnamed protein product [Trifolium pratense]
MEMLLCCLDITHIRSQNELKNEVFLSSSPERVSQGHQSSIINHQSSSSSFPIISQIRAQSERRTSQSERRTSSSPERVYFRFEICVAVLLAEIFASYLSSRVAIVAPVELHVVPDLLRFIFSTVRLMNRLSKIKHKKEAKAKISNGVTDSLHTPRSLNEKEQKELVELVDVKLGLRLRLLCRMA